MLVIREFEKKDQESAYKTWKYGMAVDWSQGLFEWSVRCTELIMFPFLLQLLLFFLGFFKTPEEGNNILIFVCLFWFACLKGFSKYVGHSYRFLVATTEEEPDNVIGTIVYVESEKEETFKGEVLGGKTWIMFSMSVCPNHRKKGIARALLEHLEKLARREKVSHVMFDASSPQTAARQFYTKAGYEHEILTFPLQRIATFFDTALEKFLVKKYFQICKIESFNFHKKMKK
ncbi:Oidioi.mRNA.OKI2018_I69.XSR.g13380.t1.cds [Oikopleura dioica]|uniref:Oidioi.mRNA.OKI2018_I69.XSR.g13380.t1.cds n=1 Tax=Oikopleura dioica TaxID=34765 RepID=A0ABN7S772_OIKDI|nr:Oidioi.mRNA.OKI2018_I69.XSR.g13380.t1.cds [Oikopleura dioica]